MNFAIPLNLPPFYKSAINHLLNELRAFPEIEKQRQIFERFCRKFTMITELWEHWIWLEIRASKTIQDIKFQKFLLKMRHRCMGHLHHENSMKQFFQASNLNFFDINNKYFLKLMATPKFDMINHNCKTEIHENHISALKTAQQRFQVPHSNAAESLTILDKCLVSKTDKCLSTTYQRCIQQYDRIMAAEQNDNEWIKCLAEVDDIEFVIQNVECRIAKNPGNVTFWSLYIEYLNEQECFRVLEVYRKFCRIYVEDIETQKDYKNAVMKFNRAGNNVTKYFTDIINFEIDFGLLKNAFALLIDALKVVKFQPKRLYNYAKKFAKKYGHREKIKKAIEKCKFRYNKYKNNNPNFKILKVTVDDLDPMEIATTFSKNIAQQYLDFPRCINNYILDNTSYDLYSKLIRTCKFFFVQKKYVVPVWYFQCHEGLHRPQETLCYRNNLYINVTQSSRLTNPNTKAKFWIGHNFVYNPVQGRDEVHVIFKILPAIYQSDIEYLQLDNMTLMLSEYDLLTDRGLIKKIRLCGTVVKKNDAEMAPLEDLMETLPNAFEIYITTFMSSQIRTEISFTPFTSQKLLNLNRNEDIQNFIISCSSHLLDPITFIQFIKKNAAPKSHFLVYYESMETMDHIQHYQDLVNEAAQLQAWWSPAEETPIIQIDDMTE